MLSGDCELCYHLGELVAFLRRTRSLESTEFHLVGIVASDRLRAPMASFKYSSISYVRICEHP